MSILQNENAKKFLSSMKVKRRRIAAVSRENRFEIPNKMVYLEKLGRIMGGIQIREAFLTKEKFGQVKKKKKTKTMFKPNNFMEQFVYLQDFKNHGKKKASKKKGKLTTEQKKREKELKARHLKWPLPKKFKQLKDFNFRVKFEEIKKGRPRAIFMKKRVDCENLRNHVILKKLQKKDGNVLQKIQTGVLAYKVKQAEYFYEHEIKSFVKNKSVGAHLSNWNQELYDALDKLMEKKVVKRPKMENELVHDFGKEKYMDVQSHITPKERYNALKKNLETLQNLDSEILGDMEGVLPRSPFYPLDKPIKADSRERALESIKKNTNIFRVDGLQTEPESIKYLNFVLENSIVITRVEKLIVECRDEENPNFDRDRAPEEQQEKEYKSHPMTQTIFEVKIGAKNIEPASARCNSYKSNENNVYVSYELDASVLVDYETKGKVQVEIRDILNGKTVLNTQVDVFAELERVHLENVIKVDVVLNDDTEKGLKGVLVFNLVIFPRNLETAHLICPEYVIDKNFERFGRAVKEIHDFASYREVFFGMGFVKAKSQEHTGRDWNFYQNNFLPKTHFSIQFQDDAISATRKFKQLGWMHNTLGSILSTDEMTLEALTGDNVNRLNTTEPFGLDKILDLYVRAASLLAPTERVLLNKALFEISNTRVFANRNFTINDDMEFPRAMFQIIALDLEHYFMKKAYLRSFQKDSICNVAYRVFFFLDNNFDEDEGNRLDFYYSRHYIPLIANVVLLNEAQVSDKDLTLLCINTIFSTMFLKSYTFTNHINYLANAVSYFKFVFKELYSDSYLEMTKLLVDFDHILAGYLFNSFADVFEPVNFAIYNDMKASLDLLLGAFDPTVQFRDKLREIGFNVPTFMDIMFLIQAFAAMFEKFKYITEPRDMRVSIESILDKQIQTAELTLKQILQLVDYVSGKGFLFDKFEHFQTSTSELHIRNNGQFLKIKSVLRKAAITEETIRAMILEQVVQNDVFCNRAASMFKNEELFEEEDGDSNKKKGPVKELSPDEKAYQNEETIDEDIFFEVAEEPIDNFQPLERRDDTSIKMRYLASMFYLNNMDVGAIDTITNQHRLRSDLNNIFELNAEEFEKLVHSYVKVPHEAIDKVFEALAKLSDSDRVPLLKFIILLILSVSEDFCQTTELLSFFIHSVSGVIFREVAARDAAQKEGVPTKVHEILSEFSKLQPNFEGEEGTHFSELIKYVLREVQGVTPFNHFDFFTNKMVDVQHEKVSVDVVNAKLHLGDHVIDITELCVRHYVTSTYTEGRPCLLFNDMFSEWLTSIFVGLFRDQHVEESLKKFDVFLEVRAGSRIRHYRIPFRITHVPETLVFCKENHRIYFDRTFDDNCLFPKSTFVRLFNESPFNFLNATQTKRISTPFFKSSRKLVLNYYLDKHEFMTVNVSFKDQNFEAPHDVVRWKYDNSNAGRLIEIMSNNLSVTVPYSVFFFTLERLLDHVKQKILLHIKTTELFKLLKLNSALYEVTTLDNKSIKKELPLYALKSYEKALSRNVDLVFNVVVKTKA